MTRESRPKQHHFVPRFYLEHFADSKGRVLAFDKATDSVFSAAPAKLARESGFYDFSGDEAHQPTMESMLSQLEGDASSIIARWTNALKDAPPLTPIVQESERETMSAFLAIQALRTSELRVLLQQGVEDSLDGRELQDLHVAMLGAGRWVDVASALSRFIWVLARNDSGLPFYTSDHPVVLRVHAHDHGGDQDEEQDHGHGHRCIHIWQFPQPGTELLFPLSPSIMFYAYERDHWKKLEHVDGYSSPVKFTKDLVDGDNQAQVGHSRRFVFCDQDAFELARAFCSEHAVVRDPNRSRFER
jgi:hypothetical protein